MSGIAGSSFEDVLTSFNVRGFSSDTISPRIGEFVELKLNSFILPLRFSDQLDAR